jgi:phage-related protein
MATNHNITITADASSANKGISKVDKGLGGLTTSAGKFKAAIGIAAAAMGAMAVAGKIQDTIDSFDNLAKSARAAGAAGSNEAFQGFQVMQKAMNEAGIDAATFDRAMLQTNSRIKAGLEGQKSFAAVTDKLGDSVRDANGEIKSGPELLKAMMNALNEGKITTEDFAKVVGGRAGPLIQEQFASLNTTAEALEGTLADVAANSNIVDVSAAENAEKFNDNIGRLKDGLGQMMTDAITPLLPMLVQFTEDIMQKLPGIIESVKGALDNLTPVFELLGTILTDIVWPILSKVFEILGAVAEAIAPLVEKSIPLLKSGFETAGEAIDKVVEFVQKLIDKLLAVPEKVKEMKDAVLGGFTDMKDGAVEKAKGMWEGVTGFFKKTNKEVYEESFVPDLVNAVMAWYEKMKVGTINKTKKMHDGVTKNFKNTTSTVQNEMDKSGTATNDFVTGFNNDFDKILADGLANGNLNFDSFAGLWKSTLSSLIQDSLSGTNKLSGIFSNLFGGSGGGGGGIFDILGSIFFPSSGGLSLPGLGGPAGGPIPLLADGGTLGAGKLGIAGEAGPELISGPATVTPMDEIGGSKPAVNITIQAIDTQTGTEFLLKNKKQIEGIIQHAYNRRGKQGIY